MIDDMKSQKNTVYLAIAGVAAAVMLLFGLRTVPNNDDWLYSMMIGTGQIRPIDGLADFVRSALNCYITENGRLATVLTQFFCGLVRHTWVFYVVNTVAFALLLLALRLWISGATRSVAVLTASLLFVLVVIPYPGQTMLWISGANSYMWATALSLLLLWHFVHGRSLEPRGTIALVGLFIISEMCGRLNESISVPVAFGWVMWLLVNRRKPGRAMAVSLAGYILGVLILLASPAGWERLGNQRVVASASELIVEHLSKIGQQSVAYATPALALVALVARGLRIGIKALARDVLLWVLVGCVIFITALGLAYARVVYFYVVIGFIIVMREAFCLLGSKHRLMQAGAVVMTLACLLPLWRAWREIQATHAAMQQALARIEAAPSDAMLPAMPMPTRRWAAAPVFDSSKSAEFGSFYCALWHKRNIAFMPPPVYDLWLSDDIEATAVPVRVMSNMPQVASTVLTYAGRDFSLVPISERYLDRTNCFMQYCLNPQHNRNNDPAIKTAFQGRLHTITRLWWYSIVWHGRYYMVTPPLEADVDRMEIPVRVQGQPATLILSRQ